MINIIDSTTLYKSEEIVCAASIAPQSDYALVNQTIPIDTTCKIYHNKNVYDYTGNITNGIPSIANTHFYYPKPVV